MKALMITLCLLSAGSAWAADARNGYAADVAVKTAQIETLRARAAASPTSTVTTTLIEADDLLSQYRTAPESKRDALRSQLEAALGRLALEIDAAGHRR